jgi:hypothetical protein
MAINSIRPYLEITVQYMSFVAFIILSMAINFIYGTFSRKTQLEEVFAQRTHIHIITNTAEE